MKLFFVAEDKIIPAKILKSEEITLAAVDIKNKDSHSQIPETEKKAKMIVITKAKNFDFTKFRKTKSFKNIKVELGLDDIVDFTELFTNKEKSANTDEIDQMVENLSKFVNKFDKKSKIPDMLLLERRLDSNEREMEKLPEYDQNLYRSDKSDSKVKTKRDKSKKNAPKKDEKQQNVDLGIPQVPLKKGLKIEANDLMSKEITDKEAKDPNLKIILVDCAMCGKKTITVPVSKKIIENSELPVTEVTYIHSNPPHAITLYIDRDFAVRRRRPSPVIFQEKKI